jgi:hypothetical protein
MVDQVLILIRDGNNPAVHMAGLLAERDTDVVLFEPGDYPSRAGVTLTRSSADRRVFVRGLLPSAFVARSLLQAATWCAKVEIRELTWRPRHPLPCTENRRRLCPGWRVLQRSPNR